MRTANLSKYLYRLFSLLCVMCIFQFLPISASAQNYDFSGTWDFNSFISGPGAPWWERGTLTVAQDGTFTGSGTQSNGASDSPSGSFSVSSSGIAMSLNGEFSTSLCMTDSSNAIMSCTATLPDGSSNLIILSRQASSTSMANLAGTWAGTVLSSEPNSSWERVSETINSDGTFTGSYTKSDGTTGSTSGVLSISPEGAVTCVSGDCLDSTYSSFISSTGTVMAGTSGAATSSQEANLIVLTKQPTSYSIGNLAGIWEVSSLATGPGAPWWQNGLLYINPDGTCTFDSAASDGQSSSQNGVVSISSAGVVTLNLGTTSMGVVEANMDIMVLTSTWTDGTTHQISILTNGYSAASSMSSVVTMSTGDTSPYGTPPGTAPTGIPSTGIPSTNGNLSYPTNNLATPQSSTPPHHPGIPGRLEGVSEANREPGGGQSVPPGAEGGPPGAAGALAAATQAHGVNQASTPATVPGQPTIVVVTPGNSGALVNFKLPSKDGGQPITRCTVTAQPGGMKTRGAGSPIKVTDLQNGTSYTFRVTAANAVGAGPPSETSRSITPGKVPNAPQIQAVKAGKGQAQISFKAPASNGGSEINSYTVRSSSGQKASGACSPITVKGLRGGTPCTFTVTATNEMGTSPPSSASRSVTPW